ncbi:protein of unknown function [Cupriavidus taiwanensis]|uniref:Uncharacterized protein n=1 Tax=Cupriavidus taiwanensis TaxID=164546 RepID=A0A375IEI3_9BURK|nr:protein of unknown function [Cupriavidus taiwanensis]
MQLLHDLRVGALGRDQAERRGLHDAHAQLLQRRHVGEARRALLAPGRQQAQLALLHVRRPGRRVGHRHHVAAQQRLHRFRIALVRNVRELHALLHRQLFHGQVQRGHRARRAVGQLAGVGLGVGDVVLHGLDRRIRRHHQAERIAGQVDDVAQVLDRVPVDLGGVRQAVDRHGHLRQRVAVGRGALHQLRRQHAAGTRLVLDDHGLAQDFRGVVGQHAERDIRGAAGGVADHQPDRALRELVGLGLGRHGGKTEGRGGGGEARAGEELAALHMTMSPSTANHCMKNAWTGATARGA